MKHQPENPELELTLAPPPTSQPSAAPLIIPGTNTYQKENPPSLQILAKVKAIKKTTFLLPGPWAWFPVNPTSIVDQCQDPRFFLGPDLEPPAPSSNLMPPPNFTAKVERPVVDLEQPLQTELSASPEPPPQGIAVRTLESKPLLSEQKNPIVTIAQDETPPRHKNKNAIKNIKPAPPPEKPKTTSLSTTFTGHNPFNKYNLSKVPTREKIITLSFDGNQLNNCADEIMAILKQKGIKANIFLTGQFIELFPETTLSIFQAGHEIGNHTWNHPHLTQYEENGTQKTRKTISKEFFLKQLDRTEQAYQRVTHHAFNPWWRAPFGEHNLEIRTWAYSHGYIHVGWTRGYDSMDWMINPKGKYYMSPAKLERKLLRHLKTPGHKIVLMHLGSQRQKKEQPVTILSDFIDKARKQGYAFAPLSDVLKGTNGFQMASTP